MISVPREKADEVMESLRQKAASTGVDIKMKKMGEKAVSGGWTVAGRVNDNNQRNNGRTDKQGTDNNQWFYEMECLNCGHKYLANGSDIWQRKCPNCQGGKD